MTLRPGAPTEVEFGLTTTVHGLPANYRYLIDLHAPRMRTFWHGRHLERGQNDPRSIRSSPEPETGLWEVSNQGSVGMVSNPR